jgi:hypothetical protein
LISFSWCSLEFPHLADQLFLLLRSQVPFSSCLSYFFYHEIKQ